MIAIVCQHENRKVHGKTKAGAARYKCKDCGKTFTASTSTFDGMRIGMDRAAQIIELLCEGMTIRGVSRITDTDPHTIIDLLVSVGERCESYMEEHIRDVRPSGPCRIVSPAHEDRARDRGLPRHRARDRARARRRRKSSRRVLPAGRSER